MKQTKASASVLKPFVPPRRITWLEKHPEVERIFTTLGAEFLCGCAWSLSLVFFAVPDINLWSAILSGYVLYMVLTMFLRRASHVAISGAFVVCDLLFGTEHDPPPTGFGRPRSPETRDSTPVLWGRLVAQASGTLLFYGMMMRVLPGLESGMYEVWRALAAQKSSLWWLLGIQTLSHGIIGAFSLKCAQTLSLDNHMVWQHLRLGTWMVLLTYPWGCPALSIMSFVWVARVFEVSDLAIVVALTASMVIQVFLAKIICEILWADKK